MKTPITEKESEVFAELLKRAIDCGQLQINLKSPYADPAEAVRDGWSWNDRHDGNAVSSDTWVVEQGMCGGDHVIDHDDGGEPIWHEGPLALVSLYVDQSDIASLATCPANQSN